MYQCCYNCSRYIFSKKKNDYYIVPDDGKYLSYKQYNGCNSLKVYLNTDNLNIQESEELQLKYRCCSNWKKHEEYYQLSIFDFIK